MPTTPDRPADQLHAAAEKLRAAAQSATPGPWRRHTASYPHLVLQGPVDVPPSEADGMISTNLAVNEAADATHIALMHPGVGLALADWLDTVARTVDDEGAAFVDHALAVARQFLGTTEAAPVPTLIEEFERAHPEAMAAARAEVRAEAGERTPRRRAAPPAPADRTDLPDRLQAVLTERFTARGNTFSEMRRQEKGPDGWPASHPVGPHGVAEVLRELLADEQPPAPADRAAVLAEAADAVALDRDATSGARSGAKQGMTRAVTLLLRLAGEAAAGAHQTEQAHPPHDSWLVEWREEGGDWAVAYPTHDHSKALNRLSRGREEALDWQWRLVRETRTYTVEPTEPPTHLPKGTNAEDCPACAGANPPYPFLCPGPPAVPAAPEETR